MFSDFFVIFAQALLQVTVCENCTAHIDYFREHHGYIRIDRRISRTVINNQKFCQPIDAP